MTGDDIRQVAERTGFSMRMVEKAARLLGVLDALNRHAVLQGQFALKGGTALHLFILDIARLSVDIDIHYTGTSGVADFDRVTTALQDVFRQEALRVKRIPKKREVIKWRTGYTNAAGYPNDLLAVDVDFRRNRLLYPIERSHSRPLGQWSTSAIPVADIHEIAAGKLCAALERNHSRDLYDVCLLHQSEWLDFDKLQLAFLVTAASSPRIDCRRITTQYLTFDVEEMRMNLLPLLRSGECGIATHEIKRFGQHLKAQCDIFVEALLQFTDGQRQFLDLLLEKGVSDASLLTASPALEAKINAHSGIRHKCKDTFPQ